MPNTVTEEGNGLSQAFSVLSTVAIILVTVAICVILFYYWKKRSLSTNEDNYTQTETGEAQNWTKLNNLRSINTWESIRQFGQYINSYPLKLKIDQSKLNADKRVSNSSKINGNVSNTFNNSNLRGSKERSPSNILSVNNPSSNKQVGEKNVDKTARQNVSYLDESIVVSAKTGPVSLVSDEFNQNNSVSQVSTSTITENTTSDDINSRTVQTVDTINTLADKSQKILSIPGYLEINGDNKFGLKKKIGKGGGGSVYFVDIYDEALKAACKKKVVVAKVLDKEKEKGFLQEISIMSAFKDEPNFAEIIGFHRASKSILMCYYPLGSLRKWNLKHRKSMEEVLYIIIGVGSAINVLHKNGVVHNDIKTDNVLLEIDYQNLTSPKLIDFGVSNVFNNNILKVAGMPLEEKKGLSIPYSAPERIAPKSVTSGALAKKGDIYSFGILMYELITEKDPWTAETRVKDLRKNRI